ncbi:hypothetical protein GcM3_220026 [Golovinomyces cichoracearum]|uniref:Uncharacterized protein n=1 Tax=Golovinomyces cichoracearum TaxID=62708 RepID=A0A420H769_9PEZI|nr:hypothetical protein GcM3_220026 [Golovinomyces cichoracearum]
MSNNNKKTRRAFRLTASSEQKSTQPTEAAAQPPAPYKRASACLSSFLTGLNTSHIYITHIDNQPREFKRKIFSVPLILNISIFLLLIWRIRTIGPWYLKISQFIWARSLDSSINTAQRSFQDLFFEVLLRARVFLTDFILVVFVWSWPREFFAGTSHGNPVSWRLGVGFRDREIVVRKSRAWYIGLGFLNDDDSDNVKLMNDNIKKAIDPIYLNEKTGYLMLNKHWDLDWKAMCTATELVDKKIIPIEEFKITVLLHDEKFGWVVLDTQTSRNSIVQDENKERRKIVALKEQLCALGKEDLFYQWVELVHFESSKPGGFGPEQQEKVMSKVKALFKSQDVEFEKLWASISGDDINEVPKTLVR